MHGRLPAVPVAGAARRGAARDSPAARRGREAEGGARGILTFLTPLLERPTERWVLVNARTGTTVARSVETAFDSASRNRGLLGRDSLGPGSALVLAPCSSIHTFFMRFPIDVAFVDRQGVILRIAANLRPWRIALALRAFAVIEMPGGSFAAADTHAGDALTPSMS